MSQPRVAGSRQRGALLLLLLAASLVMSFLLALTLRATTADAATTRPPVSYYTFRTRDTGSAATNEQNNRCNNYFGARSLTTLKRLNALLFAFNADPASGRLTDQTANLLGPGFICAVPDLFSSDLVDAYAYSSLPGPGLVEATGPCGVEPVAVSGSPVILNCALGVKPIPAKNVLGGLITSNSLVNFLDTSSSAPTGSVWTAQIVGDVANSGGGGGTVPPGLKPETPGLDFYSMRTRDEQSPNPSTVDCTATGLAGPAIAVRTANLAVAQPDAASGRIPDAVGPAVGKLTTCFVRALRGGGYRAFTLAEIKAAGKTIKVTARGDCRTTSTAAGSDLRGQACALSVRKASVQAGLITSNGLITAGAPASSADHAVWTFALFGVPTA